MKRRTDTILNIDVYYERSTKSILEIFNCTENHFFNEPIFLVWTDSSVKGIHWFHWVDLHFIYTKRKKYLNYIEKNWEFIKYSGEK